MNVSLLYTNIYNTLFEFSKDVIDVIFSYINHYNYKCSVDNDAVFTTVCYNKQLGIIYCSSNKYCKFINYLTNKPLETIIIGLQSMCSYLWKNELNNVVYFDHKNIIQHGEGVLSNYKMNDTKLNCVYRKYIGDYIESQCTHEDHIYVCSTSINNTYEITIYSISDHTLKSSIDYRASELADLYISVCKYHIYIVEICVTATNKIYIHDTNTFERIDTKILPIKGLLIRPYKDKLYHYKRHKIHVYDMTTLIMIESIDVKPFRKKKDMYRATMTIADDIIMISSCNETFLYEIK